MGIKNKEVLWVFGPLEYKNSGIYKYSLIYINSLSKKIKIKKIFTKQSPKSIGRFFWQFFLVPWKLMKKDNLKIFSDEGWLPILIYPINNIVFIVHDVRFIDPEFIKWEKVGIRGKIIETFLKMIKSKRVKIVIVPSNYTKKILSQRLNIGEKIEVIPSPFLKQKEKNKISKEEKEKLFRKYGVPYNFINKKIILFVGSEEKRKNIPTMLKAIKKLPEEYVFIKIGKPIINKNREKNLSLVKKLRIEERVKFIEKVDEKDLNKFYKISYIFWFPSLYEGFGRPPLEAQLNKTIVISSKKTAMRETLKDSAIFLKDPLNEEELVRKTLEISKMSKKEKNRIIKKG